MLTTIYSNNEIYVTTYRALKRIGVKHSNFYKIKTINT